MVGHRRPVSPPKGVRFAPALVTDVTRPLTNDEHWTLYYFEVHAVQCSKCKDPYQVHKDNKQLCDTGHDLAIDISRLLFRMNSSGEMVAKSSGSSNEVHVEVPVGYEQTTQLFRAIRKYGKAVYGSKSSGSYDKTYPVAPRIRPANPEKPSHKDREVEAVPRRHKSQRSGSSKKNRGSLYETDILDLEAAARRQQETLSPGYVRYEVRAPYYSSRY